MWENEWCAPVLEKCSFKRRYNFTKWKRRRRRTRLLCLCMISHSCMASIAKGTRNMEFLSHHHVEVWKIYIAKRARAKQRKRRYGVLKIWKMKNNTLLVFVVACIFHFVKNFSFQFFCLKKAFSYTYTLTHFKIWKTARARTFVFLVEKLLYSLSVKISYGGLSRPNKEAAISCGYE